MPILRRLSLLFIAATLTSFGCHAQTPPILVDKATDAKIVIGSPLPAAVSHRIDALLRQKADLPPGATVVIGPVQPSDINGFDSVAVSFTSLEGKSSHPINFLVSADGKTAAQLSKYDISADPRALIPADNRPFRGGPASAPVLIVGFDDLECPYCARLHTIIFPAIVQRYGDKVHIVYKDYPIEQHPWAMRGAVDVNCLAEQSPTGYWNLVDYIHAHANEIGEDHNPAPPPAKDKDGKTPDAPPDRTLERADAQLDTLTRDQGHVQKVDEAKLNACISKQDTAAIEISKHLGEGLDVGETPTLFINGDKIVGAVPIEFLFGIIDDALRAENIVPPPPYVVPAPLTTPAAPSTLSPLAKPGK